MPKSSPKPNRAQLAFPSGINELLHANYEGMTLRDYFAAAYLQGVSAYRGPTEYPGVRVTDAYKMADAMMEARDA